ncbi:MAG: DUF3482 domain-containing protein [Planctomycetales bacterium]|nr:DUF3482 domain-containing protein [Planctomycetales bacterium]
MFRDFIKRHRGQPEFADECELLQPIVDGAGVVYVVDGSKKLVKFHVAEMEILRLSGQPRLAIINRTSHDDFIQDWKQMLGSHFNAVREFNAHHATFADRLELLDTLASIEQSWKPKLKRAVTIFTEQQDKRHGESAEIIVDLLINALQHRETVSADADLKSRREQIGEELKQRFVKALSDREARAHQQIIELFRHRRVKTESTGELLFDAELFSEDTWRAFGLNEKQLIKAGAIGGAAVGASADLLTAGHTLLVGTLIGGAIGATGGYLLGKKRPELKVNIPMSGLLEKIGLGQKLDFGGRAMSVGPYTAGNFPWILLDRAFGTFFYVINRAHAQQDNVTISSAEVKAKLEAAGISAACWDDAKRKECEKVFAVIRKNKIGPEHREALCKIIRERLGEVSRASAHTGWLWRDGLLARC